MRGFAAAAIALALSQSASAADLPRYAHIVVVVEENKDYDQIIGNRAAPYLNELAAEGVTLARMFGEEHPSEGNYFWLFAGNDFDVGFHDAVPAHKFAAPNLGAELIAKGLSFKGYAEALPAIGSEVATVPPDCNYPCRYGRKHVPWISFSNVPNGATADTSSNLRFADFPPDYDRLPTVAFVIPDMDHDMHNGDASASIATGDAWLRQHLDGYYRWAKTHDSLLIVTFDENDDKSGYKGLTDPAVLPDADQLHRDRQNRIATIFAGAHLKTNVADLTPLNHVSILRTIEAVFGLAKAGAQPPEARRAGIGDDRIAAGAFAPQR